ncbi:glycosyltransferase family 4 protein [uncultured Shewanella sp.]|uniref:glycosyltransferase family 4 protein n=1 Tax=Shewanella atlantica TaxID=271099 RepID=UPI00262EF7EE|nr:glycosyltransferase family 4 protein [uncultured Shewanella sp.]
MRPQVIHLVDDCKLGGVKVALENLSGSSLNRMFDFKISTLNLHSWFPRRYRADIICLHAAVSWRKLPGLCLLRLMNIGTPLLFQEHHYSECFVRHRVTSPLRFLVMLRLSYCVVTHVLAVSNAQADWMKKERLTSRERLTVVGQAVDVSAFLKLPPKAVVAPIVLGAYGRLDSQKGFDLLLQAMAKLPPEQVELRLAGDGEELSKFEQSWGQLPHVHFVGEVQDVPRFLSRCDAVVIPSRWEPFGLSCQETLAAGKPVITSGVDGLDEQLSEVESMTSETVRLIKLEELSPERLVEVIERLIADARTLSAGEHLVSLGLSRQVREGAAQRWPRLIQRWREILNIYL